jgi:tetratricopeptide (TPR) repeat protein
MAKQTTHTENRPLAAAAIASKPTATNNKNTLPIENFKFQAIFLALISILFYANTFKHEYAFDDMMAIVSNEYVQEGVSGIGKIMTTDAYQSYLEQRNGGNQLAGGRYRPLSLVSFAIEQQLLGVNEFGETTNGRTSIRSNEQEEKMIQDMHFRHVVNVLLYALCVVVLLAFFRSIIFPDHPIAAFIAALFFAIHPLHTEVVANVKSRDEILSVLFLCFTYLFAFKYKDGHVKKHLYFALLSFFLALLSKEYAVTTVLLLPAAFYIFRKETLAQSLKSFLIYLVPLGCYFMLRLSSVTGPAEGANEDIMNNPYMNATTVQQLATKLLVLGRYIQLLFFPHPLSADYSFNQIPYTDFSNPLVWASVTVYSVMILAMIMLFKQRNRISFAIGFFLLNLVLVSNLLFNIGAPMGERLVFHSSVGFVILIAAFLQFIIDKIKPIKAGVYLVGSLSLIVVFASGFKVMVRNEDWKSNTTLFMKDVETSPNSALTNTNAGSSCMNFAKSTQDIAQRAAWMKKAIVYFTKTLTINPNHMLARTNRGLCHYNTGNPEKALSDWDSVRQKNPNMANLSYYLTQVSQLFFTKGIQAGKENKTQEAIAYFLKADYAAPNVPDVWYNLGVAYTIAGDVPAAKNAFEKTIKIAPGYEDAQKRLDALTLLR